jgi:hypothetical protein
MAKPAQTPLSFFADWVQGVGAPLHFVNDRGLIQVPATDYPSELLEIIANHKGLHAADRLGAYRMQYWFRLFTILQEQYPRLVAQIGHERFNPLAMEFLLLHPNEEHSLAQLGKGLAAFIKTKLKDKEANTAALIDEAHLRAFYAGEHPLFNQEDLVRLEAGTVALAIQPHVSVVNSKRVIWRWGRRIFEKEVERALARFLEKLISGQDWQQALERVVTEKNAQRVPKWFELGVRAGWFRIQ